MQLGKEKELQAYTFKESSKLLFFLRYREDPKEFIKTLVELSHFSKIAKTHKSKY